MLIFETQARETRADEHRDRLARKSRGKYIEVNVARAATGNILCTEHSDCSREFEDFDQFINHLAKVVSSIPNEVRLY